MLASTMVEFDPRFQVLPGTKGKQMAMHEDPYEADVGKIIPE